MGLSNFTVIETDDIKDSWREDWQVGDDLHKIRNDLKELNSSGLIDRYITEDADETSSGNLEYNSLYILQQGRLNSGTNEVYCHGNCVIRSARIIAAKLTVAGDLTIEREAGDVSYTNILDVDEIEVLGDVILEYTDFSFDSDSYRVLIGGDFEVSYPQSDNIFGADLQVGGDITYNDTSPKTVDHTYRTSTEFGWRWFAGGDLNFNVASFSGYGRYASCELSIIGQLLSTGSSITIDVSGGDGLDGDDATNAGRGGDWKGGNRGGATASNCEDGDPGTINGGGGGGDCVNRSSNGGGTGGAGVGNGGDAGSTQFRTSVGLLSGYCRGGGGGGGGTDFNMYYGQGSVGITSFTINSNGGDAGDGATSVSIGAGGALCADGGDGGDGGNIDLDYGSNPLTSVTMNSIAGTGGALAKVENGNTCTATNGSNGSAGTTSHATGSPIAGHAPYVPTPTTLEGATTSTLSWNVPVDENGDTLDFEIEIDILYTELVHSIVVDDDSNANPSRFSGTPPYTEGTGSVTYTPDSSAMISGQEYRWRVRAMKNSDTANTGPASAWRTFIYS